MSVNISKYFPAPLSWREWVWCSMNNLGNQIYLIGSGWGERSTKWDTHIQHRGECLAWNSEEETYLLSVLWEACSSLSNSALAWEATFPSMTGQHSSQCQCTSQDAETYTSSNAVANLNVGRNLAGQDSCHPDSLLLPHLKEEKDKHILLHGSSLKFWLWHCDVSSCKMILAWLFQFLMF